MADDIKPGAPPFYERLSYNLISLAILGALLYVAQGILVPLFFSILLATLLLPVTTRLQRWHIPKVIAIILSIIVTLAIIGGILYFLSSQVSNFLEDIDTIKKRLLELLQKAQHWINTTFNVSARRQQEYIKETTDNLKDNGAGIVGKTVSTITESVAYVVFLPVYTFLILFYKDLIKKFLISVFKNGREDKVREVIYESRRIGQQYVLGLMTDMVIVFTLNTIGFLVLGIKYAVFLALVGALMNLIPYIGMLVANVFCMLITMVSSNNLTDVVWVAIILAVVQIIDNNLLMPMIVGNKVRINALVTIVGVVVGGALCGVSGMFLAIPGVAVLKVIFDHVDSLKPWGMLLGDEVSDAKKKRSKPIR
jgi:predicted PurR-regulated permease PerM